jgi:hypothetical protein
MPTYVNDLRLTELNTGEGSGTWGVTTNTNLELIGESLGYGTEASFASDANATTTVADGATDPARSMYFKVTSGVSLTATRELTIAPNTVSRVMYIENATSGSQSITIKQGSGGTVTIANGNAAIVYLDGAGATAAVVDANTSLAATKVDATTLAIGGTDVTSTAAELNILDGVTSTAAELNLVDGSSAGTIVNSKAVIYGASGEVNGTTLQIAGSSITSTAAELNLLDGSSAGTVVNSKAVIYGASGEVNATDLKVGTAIQDTNGAELIKVSATGSAVNEVTVANAATGNNPTLSATGDDTNVGIDVTPKGTGEFNVTASFFTGIFSDKVSALGNTGTAKTLDASTAQVFTATLTDNVTFTVSGENGVSNRASSFILILTNDATASRTVALTGGTFRYPGGSVSRTTDANATDIWFFMSPDNGTTWYVTIPMKDMS